MKKIFLTGSTGMVGKNICEYFAISDFEMFTPSSKELNLINFSDVKNYLSKIKPDLVIHCAGIVGGIQANINNNLKSFNSNLDFGLNVIRASYDLRITKLINLGSSCFYPASYDRPLKESDLFAGKLEPTNEGYALSKLAILKLCEFINNESETFQYKTIIPCNLYGKYDSFNESKSHLIAAIIKKLHDANKNNNETIDIWGSGKVRREFLYCEDLAKFIFYVTNNFDKIPNVINFGLNNDKTILEYYTEIAKILDIKTKFRLDKTKPEGIKRKLLDTKILKSINWGEFTPFEDGIKETYKYFLENN